MNENEKYEVLEIALTPNDLNSANMVLDYSGFNHDVLDWLADEFGVDYDEYESEDED